MRMGNKIQPTVVKVVLLANITWVMNTNFPLKSMADSKIPPVWCTVMANPSIVM